MASKPSQGKPTTTQTAAAAPEEEALNSEQLEALEARRAAQQPTEAPVRAPGPDLGELEERTAEAENRAEAAERKNAELGAELQILKEQFAQLMRSARSPQQRPDVVADLDQAADGAQPVFEETEPHGVVVGDTEVAFVQDGHQFGRDRRYLRTEKHRGVPRAFNPRLVGWVKPRPNQAAVDALDGFRDS